MRVLLLSQFFEPEPTIKGLALAKALQAQGHEVRVLTGFPNYPGGKVYAGYKVKLLQREVMDGITVIRVPLYPSHDSSKFGRVLNYLSFGFCATLYGLVNGWKPDVIYVYHPPITTGIAGALIGLARRVPFVLDVQDLWPDTLRATGTISNEPVLKFVGAVMRWVYRRAAVILPQSEGFKQRMVAQGIALEKIMVVPNWAHEDALRQRPARFEPPISLLGKFTVCFAGNLGKAQDGDTLLDTASILQEARDDVALLFVGGGSDLARIQQRAGNMKLRNVEFLPQMPMHEVGAVLANADAFLVHLKNDPLFEITIPAKTQAYMFMGKPIVMAAPGASADLVRQAACGIVATPGNAKEIAAAISHLADMRAEERNLLGTSGRDHYDRELSLARAAARIGEALELARK